MKINFSTTLKDLRGKEIRDENGPARSYGDICAEVLVATDGNDKSATSAAKIARYKLALKIVNGGTVDVTSTEAAQIVDCLGRFCGPLIVGQIVPELEGEAAPLALVGGER